VHAVGYCLGGTLLAIAAAAMAREGDDRLASLTLLAAQRMPATMHSQYLRRLYLNNDLAAGRYAVDGKPVELKDIAVPMFCVATETDHVAPWQSVYKVHHLFTDEVTFVLTSGGHNAGIVSEPDHPGRRFRMLARPRGARSLSCQSWLSQASRKEGSWWPVWTQWLDAHSDALVPPPLMGMPGCEQNSLPPAPGHYVLEK